MKYLFGLLLFPLLFTGCYSTRITGYWKAPDQPAQTYKKILVLGIMPDTLMLQRMEKHISGDLRHKGFNAVTSEGKYKVFNYLETEDRDVLQQFKNDGVDAVITVVLLNRRAEGFVMPASLYHLLSKYYAEKYYGLYAPDAFHEGIRYAWETSLYDIASGKRIYAVQTAAFDPVSIESLSHEYGKIVVKCMRKHHILHR